MANEIELAILFADVVGSTKLYEQLGDLRARDMVATCVELMRAATDRHHGTVIKTMGDEIMATFPSADDALDAGAQMQRDIANHPGLKVNDHAVAIRIGCNFGPVVQEARDIFGSAVHTANRMTSQAKAGQIMTTATMVEHLSVEWRAAVRQIDTATLKGRSHEVALFEVLWQPEESTSMVPTISSGEHADRPQRLRLRYQGQEIVVDHGREIITIGRAEDNDLIVKGNLISRLHARIEMVKNKFMLFDQSTNGTFVAAKGGEDTFVRRDSMQIRGEGLIGLGKEPDPNSSQVIRYSCGD
ncbi:MAG: adenylate/guanylate cyclase domain-containing protein [Steroidobacterales bacterium]